jgi:transcriptional regulator with XRE-family HTH domain
MSMQFIDMSVFDMISAGQCRAARAFLGWSQATLAERSSVAKQTIADFERGARSPYPRTIQDLETCLSSAGVRFIENGVVFDSPPSSSGPHAG